MKSGSSEIVVNGKTQNAERPLEPLESKNLLETPTKDVDQFGSPEYLAIHFRKASPKQETALTNILEPNVSSFSMLSKKAFLKAKMCLNLLRCLKVVNLNYESGFQIRAVVR